jgi:uncharacterized protein
MADDTPNFAPTAVLNLGEDLIASPCVSVCTVDKDLGMCIGCLRTLKEIGAWRVMTLAEKKATVEACAERAKTMPRRGRDRAPLPAPDSQS